MEKRMDGWTDGWAILRDDTERRVVLFEGRQWRKGGLGAGCMSAIGNTYLEKEGDSHKKWWARAASTCFDGKSHIVLL